MMAPMWWLSLALAQSEVCQEHSAEQWAKELAGAKEALDELAIAQATVWLGAIEEAVPCLAEPAPVPLLQLHAEPQVLRHMYGQDPEGIEAWVRHRRALGPDTPWTLPSDHPVHRFAEETTAGEEVAVGPAAPPKRGGVFVDGQWAPELTMQVGARHLVQVFDDGGQRVDAAWVTGAAVDEQWIGTTPVEEPPRWFDGSDEKPERPSWKAARKDTLGAYQKYLKKHPTGEHATAARRRSDDLRWARYPATPEGARAYLADWPDGRHRADAQAILQHEELQAAVAEGTREALQLFVGRYPRGVYAAEANRRLEAIAWAAAVAEDTEQAYARYRVRWPRGEHFGEAGLAQEERAWESARSRGREGIQGYLRSWPDGAWVREADRLLAASRISRAAIEVSGDGSEALHERLAEVARVELASLGLTVVDEPGPRDGRVTIELRALDMGVGAQTRPSLHVALGVGDAEALLDDEVLFDPMPIDDAADLLADSLSHTLHRVAP